MGHANVVVYLHLNSWVNGGMKLKLDVDVMNLGD